MFRMMEDNQSAFFKMQAGKKPVATVFEKFSLAAINRDIHKKL